MTDASSPPVNAFGRRPPRGPVVRPRASADVPGQLGYRMPAEYDGEPMEIGFNPVYLADAVKVIDAEQFTFSFKGSSKPGLITEGRIFTHVLMPVSIV